MGTATATGERGPADTEIWQRRYSDPRHNHRLSREPWSNAWRSAIAGLTPGRALDLGCGPGFDTEELLSRGFAVTAVDISGAAVDLSLRRNPSARHLVADVRRLPRDVAGPFRVVIANLSLHYFGQAETYAVFAAIAGLLAPGGRFLFRVNAEDEYGAPADASSWDLVEVGGVKKQFFDERKIRGLLLGHLDILSLEKRETGRFGARKSLYEVVAGKFK